MTATRPTRGPRPGAANESDALREANKRFKLIEQESEVLRRAAAYLSQAHPSAELAADWIRGDVPGAEPRRPGVLPLAGQPVTEAD